jgi:hypothetical protein
MGVVRICIINTILLEATRRRVSDFWSRKAKIPLPGVGDYNEAIWETQEVKFNMALILTLKSGKTPRSPTEPFWNSSSGSGKKEAFPGPGFSVKNTTEISDVMPRRRRRRRVLWERESSVEADISPMKRRVGSD